MQAIVGRQVTDKTFSLFVCKSVGRPEVGERRKVNARVRVRVEQWDCSRLRFLVPIVLSVINFNHFISKFFFIIPREEESFPSKKVRQELRECCSPLRLPHARESKTVLNSGFHAISWAVFRILNPAIPDSTTFTTTLAICVCGFISASPGR